MTHSQDFDITSNEHLPIKESVITLGNFDGLHIGHKKIIDKTIAIADNQGLCSIIFTFTPHPKFFFNNSGGLLSKEYIPYLQIYKEETKRKILKELDVNYIIYQKFSKTLASLRPEEFISLIKNKLHVKEIVIGQNFYFGKDKSGDVNMLEKICKEYNIKTHIIPCESFTERHISSTYIKKLLQQGKVDIAKNMLYRPFHIHGTSIQGKRIGRKIGFPTINIPVYTGKTIELKYGVYIVKILIKSIEQKFWGVANYGTRPTVSNASELLCEIHIIDEYFDHGKFKELYNLDIEVSFYKFLRSEKKFESLDMLQCQLRQDIESAKYEINFLT